MLILFSVFIYLIMYMSRYLAYQDSMSVYWLYYPKMSNSGEIVLEETTSNR